MYYCLDVKESMRRRLDRSRHQAGLDGCVWRAGAIWRVTEREVMRSITESAGSRCMDGVKTAKEFWWRCAYGAHPFSSRTRRLRRKRPMVLYRRRYGRAGGCQIKETKPVEGHEIDKKEQREMERGRNPSGPVFTGDEKAETSPAGGAGFVFS